MESSRRGPYGAPDEECFDREAASGAACPVRGRAVRDATGSLRSPSVFIAAGVRRRRDIARVMAELYLRYRDAGVPAELHLYAAAGNRFGLRTTN